MKFRDNSQAEPESNRRVSGILGGLKGQRVLPDLPTAVLARLRGYVGGSYSTPLRGVAAELGYHPLSTASAEELDAIHNEIEKVMRG